MGAQVRTENRRINLTDSTSEASRLLRQLIASCPHSEAHAAVVMDIVLDAQVDGVRYLLLRKPPIAVAEEILLSPREQEIGRLVAKGYVNKTIAKILDISSYTVDTYIRRLFAKLNVSTRASMVVKLSEAGMLGEEGKTRGGFTSRGP